jgi:tetratricopeptide (TPR) repeat protein
MGVILFGALMYFVIKNLKKKNALLFILLLFLGTLFLYSDLFQVGAGLVGERFMFIPSISFSLLVTYLLFYVFKLPIDKKISGKNANYVYAGVLGICVLFSARVIARNPDWKTHQSIYLHDSREAPRSAKLQALLAATYIETAQKMKANNSQNTASIDSLFLEGEKGYQNSVDIYPGYGTSWNNLGMIQYTLYANVRKAIVDFKKALDIDSAYSEAWFNLGASYEVLANKVNDTINAIRHDSSILVKQKYLGNQTVESLSRSISGCKSRIQYYRDQSENCYFHTIRLKPNYYLSYIYLSRLYFSEGKYDKVIDFDNNALKKGYESDVVYVTLGNAYLMLKDTAEAVIHYEKSLRFYDKNYYVCGFLRKYYHEKGDMERARYYNTLYDSAMVYRQSHTPLR